MLPAMRPAALLTLWTCVLATAAAGKPEFKGYRDAAEAADAAGAMKQMVRACRKASCTCVACSTMAPPPPPPRNRNHSRCC